MVFVFAKVTGAAPMTREEATRPAAVKAGRKPQINPGPGLIKQEGGMFGVFRIDALKR
jgi:hypothetical protein